MTYKITILEQKEIINGYSIIWIVEGVTPEDTRNSVLFTTKDWDVINLKLQEFAIKLYG